MQRASFLQSLILVIRPQEKTKMLMHMLRVLNRKISERIHVPLSIESICLAFNMDKIIFHYFFSVFLHLHVL